MTGKLILIYLPGILTRTRNITSLEKRRRMNPIPTLTRRTVEPGGKDSGRLFRTSRPVITRLSTGYLVSLTPHSVWCNSCRPGCNFLLLQKTSAPTTASPPTSIRKLIMIGWASPYSRLSPTSRTLPSTCALYSPTRAGTL